jgi:hypothetical protein
LGLICCVGSLQLMVKFGTIFFSTVKIQKRISFVKNATLTKINGNFLSLA